VVKRSFLPHFKHRADRFGRAQILSAFAGRTSAHLQAKRAGLERQFTIIVIKRHHLRRQYEFHYTGFPRLENNPLEAYQMMEWDHAGSLEVAQVKLDDLS
jgi:hypothetical protein